ncbi:hypothetical protein [Marinimicrobium alkaliphilum]|uniref:hypothetical protein n=1 Tax=Marinimicrobium alkaliphilum TaxID=2202654 RepID=UPI000DBA9120|nr:hypothetical protein [Marinimicrobium alkaliphilum]
MRTLTLFLMITALALTGCGGSSNDDTPPTGTNGNGNGNGNIIGLNGNGNGGDNGGALPPVDAFQLPALSGLSGDADYQGALFFTATGEGEAGLYRVQPGGASPSIALVDDRLAEGLRPTIVDVFGEATELPPMISPSEYDRFIRAVPAGDFDSTSGTAENFRVGQIFYNYGLLAEARGYQRIDVGAGNPEPIRVTSDDNVSPLFEAYIQNDLNQSDNTAILNRVGNDWRHIPLNAPDDTPAAILPRDWRPVAPLANVSQARGLGYLVIDEEDDSLVMIDMALDVVGTASYSNGGPVLDVRAAQPVGLSAPDGSILLAVAATDTEIDDSEYARLWRYVPDQDGGQLHSLTNAEGDGLYFPHSIFGFAIAVPPENFMVVDGDYTYLLIQSGILFAMDFDIVRVGADGWTLLHTEELVPGNALLKTGNHLVYANAAGQIISIDTQGNNRRILDRNDPNNMFSSQDVSFFTQGTRDGWVYYNRDEQIGINENIEAAVAARADGSERIDIHNAQWIGVSHTGQATVGEGLNTLTLSEVFLLRENGELVAVGAADPAAGGVTLGQLPAGNDSVQMFGAGAGPHRLLTTYSGEGSNLSDINVIYVNTRAEQSLEVVSPSPDNNTNQRPIGGF